MHCHPDAINEATTLADLAGSDLWFTIHILQLDHTCSFSEDNVDTWPESQIFQIPAINVRAINVVNDAAEQGVKLRSDFLSAARSDTLSEDLTCCARQKRQAKSVKV